MHVRKATQFICEEGEKVDKQECEWPPLKISGHRHVYLVGTALVMESKKGGEFYTYSHTSWCSRVGVGCIYLFNQAMAADSMFPIRAYENKHSIYRPSSTKRFECVDKEKRSTHLCHHLERCGRTVARQEGREASHVSGAICMRLCPNTTPTCTQPSKSSSGPALPPPPTIVRVSKYTCAHPFARLK